MTYRFVCSLALLGMSVKSLLKLTKEKEGQRAWNKCVAFLQVRLRNVPLTRILRISWWLERERGAERGILGECDLWAQSACFTAGSYDIAGARMSCWDGLMKIDTGEPATLGVFSSCQDGCNGFNGALTKDTSIQKLNVTIFGKRVFAD